jgi:hypothetical protein
MPRCSALVLALTLGTPAHAAVLFTADFGTGQEALDAAADGDVVIVDSDIGCLDLDTRVFLIGGGGTVSCGGTFTDAITLGRGASGSRLLDLEVVAAGVADEAIQAEADDVIVAGCTLTGFDSGVRVRFGQRWQIVDNTITTTSLPTDRFDGGIVLNTDALQIRVEDNVIDAVGNGVVVHDGGNDGPLVDVAVRRYVVTTGPGGVGVVLRADFPGAIVRDVRVVDNDLRSSETPIELQAGSATYRQGSLTYGTDPAADGELFDLLLRDNLFGTSMDTFGACADGTATLELTRLNPGAPIAIGLASPGSFTLPSTACAGLTLDLAGSDVGLVGMYTASADGTLSVTPSLDAADCDKVLQAVDMTSCEASNVAEFGRTAFVTSARYTGDLGGLDGADEICNDHAAAAGLPGSYRAWLSDSTGSPSTRFTPSADPYRRVDGTPIAESWTDLTDGDLLTSLSMDEYGDLVVDDGSNDWAWTATAFDGTGPVGSTCGQWDTADGSSQGRKGDLHSRASNWSSNSNPGSFNCLTQTAHLYCFQQ